MQIAQAAQEGVVRRLERGAGVGPGARLRIVTALQVGAGTKRPSRSGDDEATHLVPAVLNRIERLGETAEHVHGDGVHDLRMIELEDGDRTVDIERDMLELHLFPLEL